MWIVVCLWFLKKVFWGIFGNASSESTNRKHKPPAGASALLLMRGFPGQFAVKAFWVSRWRFTGFFLQSSSATKNPFQWAYEDFRLLTSRKVNFNQCFHSTIEDLFMPKDLGFGCLLIRKCDAELLNQVCDSLHPTWVAAQRGCIIGTNPVRNCSLVLAGREQRVDGVHPFSLPELRLACCFQICRFLSVQCVMEAGVYPL